MVQWGRRLTDGHFGDFVSRKESWSGFHKGLPGPGDDTFWRKFPSVIRSRKLVHCLGSSFEKLGQLCENGGIAQTLIRRSAGGAGLPVLLRLDRGGGFDQPIAYADSARWRTGSRTGSIPALLPAVLRLQVTGATKGVTSLVANGP